MDNVWSSLSQRVEARLGRPLPELPPDDPADPDFLALLNQLRQADPDLAEEVINAYTGTAERLPSEAEAAAERRRQNVHRHLVERFVRPDGLRTGRVRLNLRKTINWIAAAVALFIIIWSIIPKTARRSTPGPRVPPATSQAAARMSSGSAAPTAPSSPALFSTLSPGPPPPPHAGPGVPLLTVSPPRFPPASPDDNLPGLVATPPPVSARSTMATTRVIVFEASQPQSGSTSPLVYQREASQATAQLLQSPAPVVVYDASATQASVGNPVIPPAAPDTSTHATASAVSRGQVLEVTLVTPVVVASSGGATPALAEIAQGPLQGAVLVGQATRSPEGLVLIQFSMLIAKDGKEQPFRAVAYDAQVGRLGVGGQVSTMMPGAASALLGATMQSVSDYFKAHAQQQQVTITNGFLAITQGTPSLWDGLAAAVARAFAPSAQSTTGPTVVTRLERDQAITVLIM